MSLVPVVALSIFLLPFAVAHAVRLLLPAATARRVGRAFEIGSWAVGAACLVLGVWCLHSMSQSVTPWNQLGALGLVGFVMLGSVLWASFRLGFRVLVPANRFSRFAGQSVDILGWPAA
jgi:hypothetical protein